MQKFAKFVNLDYKKGDTPHLVQGIKGGRTPKNAIRGGNGSFLVSGEPSKLILTVKTEEGKYVSANIINTVRDVLDRSRITQKLCNTLEEAFSSETFEISDECITNLEEILLDV